MPRFGDCWARSSPPPQGQAHPFFCLAFGQLSPHPVLFCLPRAGQSRDPSFMQQHLEVPGDAQLSTALHHKDTGPLERSYGTTAGRTPSGSSLFVSLLLCFKRFWNILNSRLHWSCRELIPSSDWLLFVRFQRTKFIFRDTQFILLFLCGSCLIFAMSQKSSLNPRPPRFYYALPFCFILLAFAMRTTGQDYQRCRQKQSVPCTSLLEWTQVS